MTVHVDTFKELLKRAKEVPETIKPHEVAMLAAYAESRIAELECQVLIARHADPSDRVYQPKWWEPVPAYWQNPIITSGSDGFKVPQTTCRMSDC